MLIAGGRGERLGFSDIKVAMPVCTIEEDYSYLKYYSQYVLACQARARKLNPALDDDFFVPFGIMVSDDTHSRTLELFKENQYYGMRKD